MLIFLCLACIAPPGGVPERIESDSPSIAAASEGLVADGMRLAIDPAVFDDDGAVVRLSGGRAEGPPEGMAELIAEVEELVREEQAVDATRVGEKDRASEGRPPR